MEIFNVLIFCVSLLEGYILMISSIDNKSLQKTNIDSIEIESKEELFCGTIDEPKNPIIPIKRTIEYFGKLTFKLSIYYDKSLLLQHNNDANKLRDYIYAIVNSVYLNYNQKSMRNVAEISFSITSISEVPYYVRINELNEGHKYRSDFCSAVFSYNAINMAAVLLTGHNIRSDSSQSDTSTQGLAHLNVACNWDYGSHGPCILVEARSFRAALIMAHELGHTLGMNHDEELGCGNSHIQSATTGAGKTVWSSCSINQIRNYLSSITNQKFWCFDFDTLRTQQFFPALNNSENLSYRSVPVNYQCNIGLGQNFYHYSSSKSAYRDICRIIWCTNGSFRIPLHPALENTTCDSKRFCRDGICRKIIH